MLELKESPGGWTATDGSGLHFYRGGFSGQHQERPTVVQAMRFGHVCLVLSSQAPLLLQDLEFVRAARCHSRSRSGDTSRNTWASNVIHSVYLHTPRIGTPDLVFGSMSGLGARFGLLDQLDADLTLLPVLQTVDELALWDLVAAFFGTYNQGEIREQRRLERAFIDGRLKKRRKHGQVFVDVAPETIPA